MSDHFADRATWIAALPPSDPEAASALEHARTCAECTRALEDGRQLVGRLDAMAFEPPSRASLERVAAQIASELARESAARSPVYPAVAVVAAWGLEVALARHRDLASGNVLASSLAIAGAVAVAVLSGARARAAVALALLGSLALVAALGSSGGLDAALGLKCAGLELGGAALPFAVAAWLAHRGGAALGAWRGAGVASSAALASQAALCLTCEATHRGAHLLVFHLGGVVLSALVGLGAGRELTRRHALVTTRAPS